jgi:hypothetical protein
MMPGLERSAAVQAEFNMEQHLLHALRHPHIVRLIGCGQVAGGGGGQRFTVLEWLELSLEAPLPLPAKTRKTHTTFPRVFSESSAALFPTVLPVLLQISRALCLLHGEVPHTLEESGQLEIIHRAITPEHFRYNDDPQSGLKLTSFMACHITFRPHQNSSNIISSRRRNSSSSGGSKTGSKTGSRLDWCAAPNHPTTALCYTPPEVALRLSISTKSDIYAFALLSWQLMKSRKPFSGLSKSAFMSRVIYDGKRPKISNSWCAAFSSILEACWRNDPTARPPMHIVYDNLIMVCRHTN